MAGRSTHHQVLEGTSHDSDLAVTSVDLYFAIELATAPTGTVQVATIESRTDRPRVAELERPAFHVVQDPQPDGTAGMYYVDFNSINWNKPVIVTTHAVQRGTVEDPHDTTITDCRRQMGQCNDRHGLSRMPRCVSGYSGTSRLRSRRIAPATRLRDDGGSWIDRRVSGRREHHHLGHDDDLRRPDQQRLVHDQERRRDRQDR